ncbi:T9SS type B sorting domain-containing protein [Tenacibaculum sp. 1_MG-2023]|uniref:T9SS type B sorting domain-containing protein n=1 Tax=Tenacibaculum sp. 1_MG-2023 TaxID=3062653 RepID=UPI0026E4578A|nr:T9SS type B sorting domain-containing protein [Tenacibaculum sp. 1_MG-2023]MDO6601032.1 T9SS type B sorting domain-containing protein [Tenacibaculum sp. 1_MG-2023]
MSHSQNQTNVWYFGENAGISFENQTPTSLNNGNINTLEGCSTFSDTNGNLFFYTDGVTLWNKEHQIMQYSNGSNATDLLGNPSSTQSALTIPHPTNSSLFYLFTIGDLNNNNGLNLYTIDSSKNNGLGEIVAGPINLSIDENYRNNWSERLTAVQTSNCNSFWLVSQSGNTFISYKIDENGLNTNPIISSTSYTPESKSGYLKISPDGTKLAIADAQHYEDNYGVVLFNFDDETGKVSENGELISTKAEDGTPYGIEFSKTSNKLYVSTYNYFRNSTTDPTTSTYKVFQFDVLSNNIKESKQNIYTDNDGFRGALQLASNGKIYASITKAYLNGGVDYLSVIDNPDENAQDVLFTKDAVYLNGNKATQGLPSFIQSFFSSTTILDDATEEIINNETQTYFLDENHIIRSGTIENNATYTWKKNGEVIGNEATLNISEGIYGNGIYELEIALSSCKKITATVTINFVEKPIIIYENCDVDEDVTDGITTFNLQTKKEALARNINDYTVLFFEKSDTSFSNPLPNEYRNEENPVAHEITARIKNNTTNRVNLETLKLQVTPTISEDFSTLYAIEEDLNANENNPQFSLGSNDAKINFTAKIEEIKNLYGAYSLEVKLYKTLNDAENEINEISQTTENENFTNNTFIYVKLMDNNINCDNSIGKFKISVLEIPEIVIPDLPLSLCSQENNVLNLDGNTFFLGDNYKWYFNGTLIENLNEPIYNATEAGVYKVEAYRNYQQINTTIVGYNTFTVKKSETFSILSLKYNNRENNITVVINKNGEYEYSLDNINFQNSHGNSFIFNNLDSGLKTVYIKDSNGCNETISQEISVLKIQPFITPNNDGIFDTWEIDISKNPEYKNVYVTIFDRFGKVIKTLENEAWDGTFNGQNLPPKTYWYKLKLENNNGVFTEQTGGISLNKR